MKKLVLVLVGVLLGGAVPLWAQSSPITVNNPSFEAFARSDGGYLQGSLFPTWFSINQWSTSLPIGVAGNFGVWNPQNAQYTGATETTPGVEDGVGVPDGVNMAHMSGSTSGSIWQKTDRTLEPFEYTLQVKVGREVGVPQAGAAIQVRLGNDVSGPILKSLSIPANTVASDSFQTFTLNISKAESAAFLPAYQGQNLVIDLYGDVNTQVGGQFGRVDWDVVEFSYIPEPTSTLLLAVGGVMLWRRRRS